MIRFFLNISYDESYLIYDIAMYNIASISYVFAYKCMKLSIDVLL